MSNVKKNFVYNSAYQVLGIILPLITTPYLSRILGAEKIGIYSYSYSVAYYFAMFILLGLNNYGNRSIAISKDNKFELSKTFVSIYTMQLLVSVVVIFVYCLYAIFISKNIMTWILLGFVISSALDINWFFFGLEEFKLTVIRNTIIKLLTTVSIFVFVKSPSDLYKYSIIMVLGMCFSQIVMWPFVRKHIVLVKFTIEDVLKHIKPNLLLFIPIIAISLYKVMDKIMLGRLSDMDEVGFYESSERVLQVPLALVNSLATVMLPKMSNLYANNATEEANRTFNLSIVFSVFMSSSVSFGILGLSKVFVPWYYGNGFEKCIVLFEILMPSCIFVAFAGVIRTQYLIPKKKDKSYIISIIVGAFVNIVLNFLLIPHFASIGAAIGTFAAEMSVCICQVISVYKEIQIKKNLFVSLIFVLSGFIMALVLLQLPNFFSVSILELIIKAFLGAIIYLFVLFVLLLFNKKSLKEYVNYYESFKKHD